MGGYLMRLVTRTRAIGATQPVRPFVRSASPIAERDQRIGMTSFEGPSAGDSSDDVEADSEIGLAQGEVLQLPTSSGITTAGMTTVQRKVAGPPPGPAASPTPGSIAEGMPISAGLRPTIQTADHTERFAAPGPNLIPFETVSQPGSEMSKPPINPPLNPPLASLPLTKGEGRGGGPQGHDQVEASAFQPDAMEPYLRISSHADPHRRAEPGQLRRDDADKLSTRQARQTDTPRLEPSARTFARYPESSPVEAGISADETAEGPRVVIGRVNVEVVPPPATPSSATAPRPGPLTAASASVIGPLGGGIRPNLRLSLRHR